MQWNPLLTHYNMERIKLIQHQSILIDLAKTLITSWETLVMTLVAPKPNFSQVKSPMIAVKYSLESSYNNLQDAKSLIKNHQI